ncbi:uncharacterized protein LOC114293281 [Camellia sinensis]|uniref:uncharacterized protein LOC114293281 n=1 Tax=Camellia sinensis TaxID=4442 RepID=UPI0010362193|nr:uncharacterized protein LOC114293281 [Camellia sinensis]
MLIEFFTMNRTNSKAKVEQLLYREFTKKFVWVPTDRMWYERKQKTVIGRIINLTEGARYYLRLLLNHVRAPTSFQNLKIVNRIVCESFRQVALQRSLLEDDDSQEKCLDEATNFRMPSSLRQLFATILVYCNPNDPKALFSKFEKSMAEDSLQKVDMSIEQARYQVLQHINSTLESMGKNIQQFHLSDLVVPINERDITCKELRKKKVL